MLIGFQFIIVFSTYFIFCRVLVHNQITSIQSDTFNDLPSLTNLYVSNSFYFPMLWLTKHEYAYSMILFIFHDSMWDVIMKWRFKPWWPTIPSILTKQTITSDLNITDHNKDQYIYRWKFRYWLGTARNTLLLTLVTLLTITVYTKHQNANTKLRNTV
jgi:hypothetical protein